MRDLSAAALASSFSSFSTMPAKVGKRTHRVNLDDAVYTTELYTIELSLCVP